MLGNQPAVLFHGAPCGYHLVNQDGIVVDMNDTLLRWLRYERQEVIGRIEFASLIDADLIYAGKKLAALEKSKGAKADFHLLRKDGGTLQVTMVCLDARVITSDPSIRLFASIDNTRCHEALERIKTLDQELEAFSYSISHDLRAPLRSIDGYSKILQEDYASQLDAEGRRVLNVVMNNARRMGKLIDDLLDFGRLGRKEIQRGPVNMTAMVHAMVQDLRAHEPARKVQVVVDDLPDAHADAEMIKQVWFNLLDNAFKYTGKKAVGEIEVRSCPATDQEVCYLVRDNGVGFDMQYAGKLFGVFQRLHKIQDFSGTGVGLAIVKRIVLRHGGRVWAESTVNGGATFYFTLPREHEST